jgi:hypothetical protein
MCCGSSEQFGYIEISVNMLAKQHPGQDGAAAGWFHACVYDFACACV